MKNVFVAVIFSLFCVPALADSCGSGSCGTVTSRPVTSAIVNVVRRPVGFFRGVRSRFQSQRSARQLRRSPVRTSRSNSCGSGSCGY